MAHIIDPVLGVRDVPVSREDMLAVARAEEALKRMGLSLYCPRCQAWFGAGRDGVRGYNHPSDSEWVIACGCSRRVWRRAP